MSAPVQLLLALGAVLVLWEVYRWLRDEIVRPLYRWMRRRPALAAGIAVFAVAALIHA